MRASQSHAFPCRAMQCAHTARAAPCSVHIHAVCTYSTCRAHAACVYVEERVLEELAYLLRVTLRCTRL